jgi:hypothetical protein
VVVVLPPPLAHDRGREVRHMHRITRTLFALAGLATVVLTTAPRAKF